MDGPDPTELADPHGAAFAAAASHEPRWPQRLAALVDDAEVPAAVRARAIEGLTSAHPRHLLSRFMDLMADPEPRIRVATVEAAGILVPEDRVKVAGPALSDPVREVRLAAGRVLVGAEEELAPALAPLFVAARNEWMEVQRSELDSGESWSRLARLHATLGRGDDAERSLRRALELDPRRAADWASLAELYEATGRPLEAERALEAGLARNPEAPALVHARGLAHIRAGRREAALADLGRAATLDPDSARYAYVHVVAVLDLRGAEEAREELEAVLRRHPRDPELLSLAVSLHEQRGDRAGALAAARVLEESDPGNPEYQALVLNLRLGS